jgi:carboxylesterase type B
MSKFQANGGLLAPAPFKRAILQSPAFFPFRPASYQENATQNFLALLNVSTIAEARTLPSAALIQANQVQSGASPYGEFVYGPEVDGTFLPEYVGKLLASGQFDHSVEVMVAHNSNEGPLFTDPHIIDNASFDAFVATLFPSGNKTLIGYVTNVLYPPVFDGSHPYSNNIERAVLLNSEMLVLCNTFYLDTALSNTTFDYLFAAPPGTHGADLPYTFYSGPFDSSYDTAELNATVASILQDYILSFVKTGSPSTAVAGLGGFARYGASAQTMRLGIDGIGMTTDPAANQRCRWWQLGLDWH